MKSIKLTSEGSILELHKSTRIVFSVLAEPVTNTTQNKVERKSSIKSLER